MLQRRFVPLAISLYLLIVQLFSIECRPRMQKVLVQDHEWTVPDEPGWEDLLQEAERIRSQLLNNCATAHDCRLAAEQLRQVFLKHPSASKYQDDIAESDTLGKNGQSIFRWG